MSLTRYAAYTARIIPVITLSLFFLNTHRYRAAVRAKRPAAIPPINTVTYPNILPVYLKSLPTTTLRALGRTSRLIGVVPTTSPSISTLSGLREITQTLEAVVWETSLILYIVPDIDQSVVGHGIRHLHHPAAAVFTYTER